MPIWQDFDFLIVLPVFAKLSTTQIPLPSLLLPLLESWLAKFLVCAHLAAVEPLKWWGTFLSTVALMVWGRLVWTISLISWQQSKVNTLVSAIQTIILKSNLNAGHSSHIDFALFKYYTQRAYFLFYIWYNPLRRTFVKIVGGVATNDLITKVALYGFQNLRWIPIKLGI